ncbi:hypothetical protein Lal_00012784 [Lupinus albus]|nr:hypothetical protein Lal_00012784 [Lupinus albus]
MYISDAFNHHVIDYQDCVIDYQDCVINCTVSDAQARISRSSEASRTDTIILKIKIWGVTLRMSSDVKLSTQSLPSFKLIEKQFRAFIFIL